ncbi:MAG: hypothetical protein ABSB10_00535 [Candidatus Bathyarchaeia archaeon]|jgi:hypothetical protein
MRRGKPHEALTEFRLCKEFGWTIQQLKQQPAKRLQEFLVILSEIDKQSQEEMEKMKHQGGFR